jgi:hypothetical protein
VARKPLLLHKLTPAQIALVDRLAGKESGVQMDAMEYREFVAYQELDNLGLADMRIVRRKAVIVLTALGVSVRDHGYLSKKPVIRLTEPQIAALRFIVGGWRYYRDIPAHMIDVCRRISLRGWAEWEEDADGHFRVRITTDGWQILKLVDSQCRTMSI